MAPAAVQVWTLRSPLFSSTVGRTGRRRGLIATPQGSMAVVVQCDRGAWRQPNSFQSEIRGKICAQSALPIFSDETLPDAKSGQGACDGFLQPPATLLI